MKPPILFQPAAHPHGKPLPPMTGEATAYGLVIHPACQTHRRDQGHYDISDRTTGALVCESRAPGRNAALDALTARVRAYYQEHPGGDFRAALATARGQLAKPKDFNP
ncbi:MAG: hypothetical protein WC091_18165 [Sulfuricellaceae bacterium]